MLRKTNNYKLPHAYFRKRNVANYLEPMKTIEFDESQLGQLDQLAETLVYDQFDPRSNNYKRLITRPKINWFAIILWCITPIVYTSIYVYLLYKNKSIYFIFLIAITTVLYLICTAKWLIIYFIKIYQRFSPESIRLKCRFEPSCSEYMIQAIQKHGIFKGIKQGISRLKRCNINGGGFDEP